MAASAMTPKLLGRISNEKYHDKNKWKVDDIALGPANELLISGHNLEISETFISMYKEYSGKYENFPEFNKNFDQTQPGKQLVLFLEGSSIIGLKVESTMRFISIEDMGVLKTFTWKRSPTCVCFYRGKLYTALSSLNIVSVFNLDSEDKSCIILSDMRSDCVLEFVVVMDKIYVCTKDAGRALVFSMTGSKKMEFKNAIQTDTMAKSICIHECTEFVFVLWSNFQIQLYSQKTSRCLYAFDLTEELHKILVTTENILVTLSASKCIVTVYDVGKAIKFGEFQNTILSSVEKKQQNKLTSAPKQSKVEKLRDTKELYMKQLEENENLRRQYDRDVQKTETEIEKLQHEKKQLEKEKDSLQRQQQHLRNEIKKEKHLSEINKQDFTRAENARKTLEQSKAMLEKEKEYLEKLLAAEERNETEMKKSLEKFQIYSSNSTRTRHFVRPLLAKGGLLNPDLKVAVTVTLKGAHMHIPETGVKLDIPTGAIKRKRLIEMTIIPFDKQFAPIENFSSNSSAVVELLPNKATFDMPVRLKLPHCLQLKNDYKDSKNPVRVFVSHHEAGSGPPVWKEDLSAKCTLEEDHCVIRLKHFCWVKYEINDKIVVAKRLKVFTAGKSIHPNDSIAEIEVGYHMDLPGRAEDMTASLGMEFCQNKPFVFVKDGELSLQLVLSKIVPKEWTYITPDDNPKTISYKSVADDKDTSCPFALQKSSSSERKPYCIFKILQGNESVELSMRF